MISNVANSKRLSKIQYEKSFLNQFRNSFIQFAIEVDDPKNLPDVLDKIKNATTGLYIKSDGLNLLSNSKDQKTVTVYQIPKDVNSLSACCDWIFDKHTPNTNSSLATIACDDRRIVINSNQSITDTEYFVNLLKNIQNIPYDKFFTHKNPIPLHFQRNIVKNEFDEFLETKYHHLKEWPAFQPSDLTFLSLHDHPLNSPDIDHLQHMCKCDIKISELSPFIYDKYIR